MSLNKLSCSSTSYKNFTRIFEASAVVFSSVTHFVYINSELEVMVSESVLLTNYSKTLILDSLDLRLFRIMPLHSTS